MSVWSAIRRSPATLALLGGAGQFLGEMNKSREALEAEKRAGRTRMGELTLRQLLEEQSKTAAERRQQGSPLYQAQLGQAQAGQEAQRLSGLRTQQEIDLAPGQVAAEIAQKQAYTKYLGEGGATGIRGQQQNQVRTQAELVRLVEDQWIIDKQPLELAGKWDDARDLAAQRGLNSTEALRYKDWLNGPYKTAKALEAAEAKARASKPDLDALIRALAGGEQPVQPGATATVAVPGAVGGLGAPDTLRQELMPPGGATPPVVGPKAQQAIAMGMARGLTWQQAYDQLAATSDMSQ